MSDLKIGELYFVKELFWFLFPTKELAAAGRTWARPSRCSAANIAKVLSERYNCNVAVVEENTYVVFLEMDEDYSKVLDSNGNIGWIRCWSFYSYFELVKE